MLGTCPDIAFAVLCLCQFQSNLTKGHVGLAKHILRYLQGIKHLRLCLGYHDTHKDQLVDFTDSDHTADINMSHFTLGLVFQLGHGVVCWSLHKQQSMATSIFDAAYEACQQLCWLKVFSEQIEHLIDSQCFQMAQGEAPQKAHPHYGTRCTQIFQEWIVKLERIATKENIADIFTKLLSKDLHEKHMLELGLV